jgi:hypothetical protein
MTKKLLFIALLILSGAGICLAQSTMTWVLMVPPSATVAGSGCACNGACGPPDSTWLTDGTFATLNACQAAIPMAQVPVTDKTGATSTNDCSGTAQCVPGAAPR